MHISYFSVLFAVVLYIYEIDVFKENVVMGNDALMKCQIPSLVSDLVSVDSWVDSKGNEFLKSDNFGNNNEKLKVYRKVELIRTYFLSFYFHC